MTGRNVNGVFTGWLAVLALAGPVRADWPLDDPAAVQWLPVSSDAAVQPSVPVVPLPPAFYGSLAAVGMMVALRQSRHWRWVTLRG